MNEDKSVRYHRLKRRAAVLSVIVSAAFLIALAATGASVAIRRWAGGDDRAASSTAAIAQYVLALAVLYEAISLPIAFYRSFLLERRYALSTESAGTWIGDHVKAFAISTAIALAGTEFVYLTLRSWPVWWWAISAGGFFIATIGLANLAPIVLLPVFYKFKPLERDALRSRLASLSTRAGVPVLGVYEWGLGEKTRRANAALVGTGRTRRILVSNTLLAHYSDDEVEVILAHEIGHHANHDISKALAVEGGLLALGFYVAARVLERVWAPLGLASPADVTGLPVLLLTGGAVSLVLTPAINAVSRFNERRADGFALKVTGRPAAFVSAMRRLASQNMAEERPSTPVLWLFHTHPPVEERIALAKSHSIADCESQIADGGLPIDCSESRIERSALQSAIGDHKCSPQPPIRNPQ